MSATVGMEGSIMYEEYNRLYLNKQDFLAIHIAETIDLFLKENQCQKVLDIGSGSGNLLKYLASRKYDIHGLDINPFANHDRLIRAEALSLPFKSETFDAVTAISIIEHIDSKNGHNLVQEIRRVLRKGGVLFIITPNRHSMKKLILRSKWFYDDPTHVTYYSLHQIRNLLSLSRFNDIRFTFNAPEGTSKDWELPNALKRLPGMNKFLISTFIGIFLKDTIWASGRKYNK